MLPSIRLAAAVFLASRAFAQAPSIQIPANEALRIGHRIWQNECSGSIQGLTSWNHKEEFASLGIGHFIWYPEQATGPSYEESFPKLADFLARNGANVPAWLKGHCPWPTRDAFWHDIGSPRMNELRNFLAQEENISLQARFMAERMQESLPKILSAAPPEERETLRRRFELVAARPNGFYALTDYVNFKGEGVAPSEQLDDGTRWGLLQVLQGMQPGETPLAEFASSADRVLENRVNHMPPENQEEYRKRWLPVWRKRVATYRMALTK